MKSLEETNHNDKNQNLKNCDNQYSNFNDSKISTREKFDLEKRQKLKRQRRCVSETLVELSKECNFYYWTISYEDRDIVEISKNEERQLIKKYTETLRNAVNSRLKISNKSALKRIAFLIFQEATPGKCRPGYASPDHIHMILAVPKCLDDRFMMRCITGTEPQSYQCRKTHVAKTVEGCVLHEKIVKIPNGGLELRSYLMTAVSGLDGLMNILAYNSKSIGLNNIDRLDDFFTIL